MKLLLLLLLASPAMSDYSCHMAPHMCNDRSDPANPRHCSRVSATVTCTGINFPPGCGIPSLLYCLSGCSPGYINIPPFTWDCNTTTPCAGICGSSSGCTPHVCSSVTTMGPGCQVCGDGSACMVDDSGCPGTYGLPKCDCSASAAAGCVPGPILAECADSCMSDAQCGTGHCCGGCCSSNVCP